MSNRSKVAGRPRRHLAQQKAAEGLRRETSAEKWRRERGVLDDAADLVAGKAAEVLARKRRKHRARRP